MYGTTSGCETKTFFVPVFSNFCTKTIQLSSHATLFGRGVRGQGDLSVFFSAVFFFFLSILHLLANLVAQDLVPINLGARHRKLAA